MKFWPAPLASMMNILMSLRSHWASTMLMKSTPVTLICFRNNKQQLLTLLSCPLVRSILLQILNQCFRTKMCERKCFWMNQTSPNTEKSSSKTGQPIWTPPSYWALRLMGATRGKVFLRSRSAFNTSKVSRMSCYHAQRPSKMISS